MARRKKEPTDPLKELTDLELELMQVLWERGDATAAEVAEALRDSRNLADTTVHTVLANLRRKGAIEPIPTVERAMRYAPRVEKRHVADRHLKHVLRDFFGGSPRHMLLHLLKDKSLDEKELAEIRALLRDDSKDSKESAS